MGSETDMDYINCVITCIYYFVNNFRVQLHVMLAYTACVFMYLDFCQNGTPLSSARIDTPTRIIKLRGYL